MVEPIGPLSFLRWTGEAAVAQGTNEVSLENGLTTSDQNRADVMRISKRPILLADRSKIGTVSLRRYGSVHVLITSARQNPAMWEAGVVVELAGKTDVRGGG